MNTAVLFVVAQLVKARMFINIHVTVTDIVSILRKIMDNLRVKPDGWLCTGNKGVSSSSCVVVSIMESDMWFVGLEVYKGEK